MNGFINVKVGDGPEMRVWVARPDGAGPHPGILVFQEAYGVNSHIRDVSERLARLGFLAAAPELFHRTVPGFEGDYKNSGPAMAQLNTLTNEGLEADVRATFDLLRNDKACNGRIASIGFCMGGRVSWIANSTVPLTAAVSFYGGGIAPNLLDRATKQTAPILLIWGGLDQHIGGDKRTAIREALTAASKPFVEALFSSGNHGFFCDQRASYNAAASRDAWALATSFLSGR
ncbi:MAG: dienelactone hydrolase family protein [Thermoanaerobaculia bacterium]